MTSHDANQGASHVPALHSLVGQVALVTGGSRGIGRAAATALGRCGASVALVARRAPDLKETAHALSEVGVDVSWHTANVGEPADAKRCVEAVLGRHGRLDILVNNAATNPHFGPLMELDAARADKTARVNIYGVVAWTQAAWRAWMAEHGGTVINVASVGGLATEPSIGFYNATKAAVIHLTRQLAAELAPGVRVNAVAPGLTRTSFARALWSDHEQTRRMITPLGRIGEPDDIAGTVVFLAGASSQWMTGHTIVVDGGQLVSMHSIPRTEGL